MDDTIQVTGAIGEVRDIVRDSKTNEIIEDRGWQRNCIVNDIGKLVACLLSIQAGYTGIQYWAIGSGQDTWDPMSPPAPSKTDTKLVNEIGRKPIPQSAIKFVDNNGGISVTPTNRLLIEMSFTADDINGAWREMAIIGGNATSAKDSGILLNHRTHKLIGKDTSVTVDRQMRFTFV